MARSLFSRLSRQFGPRAVGLSRRQALRGAGAAGAAMLLSGCATAGRSRVANIDKRVIVVGAGFAGLACAYELRQAGYDVNVFEARRRLGGRVLSLGDFLPGQIVEAGGEFLSPHQPTWAAYRERFGLELVEAARDQGPGPVVIEGKRLGDSQARALFEEMRAAYGRMLDDARKVIADEPWRTADAESLDMRTMADWLAGQNVSPLCRRAIAADLEGLHNVPLGRQSYLAKLAQIKGGGLEEYLDQSRSFRCKGGGQQLASHLARALGESRIYLGSAVVSIQAAAKATMLVATADGKTYEADDVVLAVAPSVWKKIQIYPDLPAVLRVQMGSAVKYLMAVADAFWRGPGESANAFSDGPVSRTWSASAAKSQGAAALIAFSGGPAADAVCKLDPDTRDAAYLANLQPLFPQIGRSFKASRFVDWPADPWTQAGYSFPAPGDITTTGPILRKGLGSLHFAGEHTCCKFAGSMEGALNSGASLARRLAIRDGVLEA